MSHASFVSALDQENDFRHNHNNNHNHNTYECFWNLLSIEVIVILFIFLINKIGQEIVVSGVPTICGVMFGWNSQTIGYYMSFMGAIVLPSAILVGRLADGLSDKSITQYLAYFSLLCIAVIINTNIIQYSSIQYIIGNIFLFSFLSTIEGVLMALLSKLISPKLATGTFNSGLLATEAGNIGRVIGDMSITFLGESLLTVSSSSPTTTVTVTDETKSNFINILINFFKNYINALYTPIAFGIMLSILLISIYSAKFDRNIES